MNDAERAFLRFVRTHGKPWVLQIDIARALGFEETGYGKGKTAPTGHGFDPDFMAILNPLKERGFIERNISDVDRPEWQVRLTSAGLQKVDELESEATQDRQVVAEETDSTRIRAPKVFLSYSHDNQAHKDWVLNLARDLRKAGIDAILDAWDLRPGQDVVRFMERGIAESDRVLLICSDRYVERANAREGGVGYEGLVITGEVVSNIDTKKFIPLVRNNASKNRVPTYLVREIHDIPSIERPELGENPYSSDSHGAAAPSTFRFLAGKSLDDVFEADWFLESREAAFNGLGRVSLVGHMELNFALNSPLVKTHKELLAAADASQIHTFGWPLGVVLTSRAEDRPRPTREGIVAEILRETRSSYDYWGLRTNGDFYLLQSLFEDERAKDAFSSTRESSG